MDLNKDLELVGRALKAYEEDRSPEGDPTLEQEMAELHGAWKRIYTVLRYLPQDVRDQPMRIGIHLPLVNGQINIDLDINKANEVSSLQFCSDADIFHALTGEHDAWVEPNVNIGEAEVAIRYGVDTLLSPFNTQYELTYPKQIIR